MLRRLFPAFAEAASPRPARLAHRPFAKRDVEHMRWASSGGWVMPADNPGIRVEPSFVSEAEAAAILAELRAAADAYGYSYEGDDRVHSIDPASGEVKTTVGGVVNNIRVTGRPEKAGQRAPPWGYGDDFDAAALPQPLAALAARIATCGGYHVGAPRDLTVNARTRSFFQLDPHLDPAADGPDVFILGLESSVVLTFTPPDALLQERGLGPRRREPREVGLRSWTDGDIDVLCAPRTLLHFTGAARSSWMHAIRAGVQVDLPSAPSAVCDWWGKTDYLVRRGPERTSCVLAFGSPLGGTSHETEHS